MLSTCGLKSQHIGESATHTKCECVDCDSVVKIFNIEDSLQVEIEREMIYHLLNEEKSTVPLYPN
jgi:hypothetical protein